MTEKWTVQINENTPPTYFYGTLEEAAKLEEENGWLVRLVPTQEQRDAAKEWRGVGLD